MTLYDYGKRLQLCMVLSTILLTYLKKRWRIYSHIHIQNKRQLHNRIVTHCKHKTSSRFSKHSQIDSVSEPVVMGEQSESSGVFLSCISV